MSSRILQFVEIDIDYCSLTYGVAPCQAFLASSAKAADYSKVLLHFDDANSPPTFTDNNMAGSAHTWTAHGNVLLDAGTKKFGASSLFCDGTGDFIDTPDHVDFSLGSADFTIDCWFNRNGGDGTFRIICAQLDSGGAVGRSFLIGMNTTNKAYGEVSPDGSALTTVTGTTSITATGWHHLAFVRTGNILKLFLDGVQEGGDVAFSGSVNNSSTKLSIGAPGEMTTLMWNGWIDELRISPGIALWTSNFTPPTAAYAPATGTIKCFNTLNTCQDRANFTNVPETLRFAVPTQDLPASIECIPSIRQITFDPAVISLGQNLGQRATLTVSFNDHPHSDAGQGFDKYLSDRPYDPYSQGTFWGKFRARQPFLRGRPLRWIQGDHEQAIGAMETRHYIIDSFSGPDNDGIFKIVAKDVLKLADGDRALAPIVSEGFLVADITNSATTMTASPTNIGATYSESGYANIGGSEIVSFTRGGIDSFTKLLLHGDGADASTTFTDASTAAHGNATVNGNAQVDTAQSKFGGASALFDGTGDFLTYANHADWELGSGDFTIDWWERRSSATSGKSTIARDSSTSFAPWIAGYSDGTNLLFYASSNGASFDIANGESFGAIELNVWHHFAVVRSGINFYLYKDGIRQSEFQSALSFNANSNSLSIGRAQTTGDYAGWIDELRISKGVARWTGPNFLPPAAAYTSTLDVFAIVRGQLGTTGVAHSTQDRIQQCLRYVAQGPDDIISDLLRNYASVPESYIDIDAWHTEIAAHLNRLYTATIAQPTSVNTLVSELIEQAGLSMWWNDRDQLIGMLVLRGLIYTNYLYDESNILTDTLQIAEQPDKRLSQVHTYFGQINPLTTLTEKSNYRSVSHISDAQTESDYGSPAIKEIFSRWIPALGRTIADRLGDILIGRFKDPPRKINVSVMRNFVPEPILANGYQIEAWPLQDETGAPETVNVQITKLRPNPDVIEIETEEVLFTAPAEDLTTRNIIVDANTTNLNLRSTHDLLYPAPQSGDTVILTVNSGVSVSSTNAGLVSLDIGNWPAGVTIIVHIVGGVLGAGGNGGSNSAGVAGGTALLTTVAINLSMTGSLWGGGGGGGSNLDRFGGGGGAGTVVGLGGAGTTANGSNGTASTGGASGAGSAGAGGNAGQAGVSSTFAGGAAGNSINGVSLVTFGTWNGTTFTPGSLGGDLRGPMIN